MIFQSTANYADTELKAAMSLAIVNNEELIIPPRREPYLISNTVRYTLTDSKELRIKLLGGATLKSRTGLAKQMLDISGDGSLHLSGAGKLDCSGGSHIVGVQSSTALAAKYLNSLVVTGGLHFYAGEDYKGEKGDSAITAGSSKRILIADNCLFEGWSDTAIYLTGDNATQPKGSGAVVRGCHFLRNSKDIVTKRLYYATTVDSCFFKESQLGIATLNTSSKMPAGLSLKVMGNHFDNLVRPITVRMSDNAIISNNVINGWGFEFDGADLTRNERAILINGSLNTSVKGNVFVCGEQKSYAIEQRDYEYEGVEYLCGLAHMDNTFRVGGDTKPYADVHASLPSSIKSAESNAAWSKYVNPATRREIIDLNTGHKKIFLGTVLS